MRGLRREEHRGFVVKMGAGPLSARNFFPGVPLVSLRAVIFDLDGTLRHNQPSWPDVFLEVAQRHGVPVPPEARRRLKRWAHHFWASSAELKQMLRTYGESEDFWLAYTRRRLQLLGCPPEEAESLAPRIHAEMVALEEQVDDVVPPQVPQTLDTLRRQGYRLALLTNRREPLDNYLSEIGLEGYFDPVLVAGELGAWKPDPAVFLHAVQHLNLRPAEVAYVGDNMYADVLGAQAAGLRPILLDPEGLFPEAPCPVITCIADLPQVLERMNHDPAEP